MPARPGPGWPHNPSKGRRPTNSRASDHVDPHEDGRVVAARNQSRAKTRAMLNPMDWTQPALERHRPQDLASRRGDRRRVVLAAARKPSPRSGHIWIGQEPIAAPEARRGHPSSHDTAAGAFLGPKERLIKCAFAVFAFVRASRGASRPARLVLGGRPPPPPVRPPASPPAEAGWPTSLLRSSRSAPTLGFQPRIRAQRLRKSSITATMCVTASDVLSSSRLR